MSTDAAKRWRDSPTHLQRAIIVTAPLTVLLSMSSSLVGGWVRGGMIATVVLLAAISALLGHRFNTAKEAAKTSETQRLQDEINALSRKCADERQVLMANLRGYLGGTSRDLAGMFDGSGFNATAGSFRAFAQAVCEGVRRLTTTDARCRFYETDADQNGLTCAAWSSGQSEPSKRFDRPDLDFMAMERAAREAISRGSACPEGYQFFPDLKTLSPPGYKDRSGRKYASYIGVPVLAGKTWVGWLTLDSPQTNVFNEIVDVSVMEIYANVLAVAYARLEVPGFDLKATTVAQTAP